MLARIVVSGASLLVAALVVPGIQMRWGRTPVQAILTVGLLALIFGLVNAYLRPILKAVSLPLNLVTLGLFSFVVNAGLLLFVAYAADVIADRALLRIGDYPPTIDTSTIIAAVLGSIVISAASTVMSLLTPDA
jgi:putative membrane protein